jgi:two-component system, sensor histidine kinase
LLPQISTMDCSHCESCPTYTWITGVDGSCIHFNKNWLEFTGRQLDQELGFGWCDSIHPDDKQKFLSALHFNLQTRLAFELEFRLKVKNEEYKWIQSKARPHFNKDNLFLGFAGSNFDITQFKISMENLKCARQSAETANIVKTQFLANMSHEIRTPVGIILGFTDIIRNRALSESERNNLLDRILKNGHQLLHLIDDILDVSKVEANRIQIETIQFSLRELIVELKDFFEIRAHEKGLKFNTSVAHHVPDEIKSDPTRIRQILTNIIGNSIKFTRAGEVELIIDGHPDGIKFDVIFKVKDTGVGLKPESIDRIFKPFSQMEASTNRQFGGTGLGLYLSRKLAHALGGELYLQESQINTGSIFCFQIPVEKVTQSQLPTQFKLVNNDEKIKQLKGIRVLAVDDFEENRMLLGNYLIPFGIDIKYATNGEEAVEKCHSEKFDIVLMDLQMPVLDGYGALRKIREFDRITPIIALTAHALKTEKAKCLRVGFGEHVTKPVSKEKLVASISTLISQR